MKNWIMGLVISGCTLFLLNAFLPLEAHAITLAQNGKSDYSIVLADDASPSEIHGAKELQSFFEMIKAFVGYIFFYNTGQKNYNPQ